MDLMLRHSPSILTNALTIKRCAMSLSKQGNNNIFFSFPQVRIKPTTCHVYSRTLVPCATIGLKREMSRNHMKIGQLYVLTLT